MAPREIDFPVDAPAALVVLVAAAAPVPDGFGAVVGEPGEATVPFVPGAGEPEGVAVTATVVPFYICE